MKKLFFLFVLFFFGVKNIFACSCLIYDFETSLEKYDLIFSADVSSISKDGLYNLGISFENIKNFKGDAQKVDFYTINQSSACGFEFEKGEKYLVFSSLGKNNKSKISLCSRTGKLENNVDFLKLNGEKISDENMEKVDKVFGKFLSEISSKTIENQRQYFYKLESKIFEILHKKRFDFLLEKDKQALFILDYLSEKIKVELKKLD